MRNGKITKEIQSLSNEADLLDITKAAINQLATSEVLMEVRRIVEARIAQLDSDTSNSSDRVSDHSLVKMGKTFTSEEVAQHEEAIAQMTWNYAMDIIIERFLPVFSAGTELMARISRAEGIVSAYPNGLPRKTKLIDALAQLAEHIGSSLSRVDVEDQRLKAALGINNESIHSFDLETAIRYRDGLLAIVTGKDSDGREFLRLMKTNPASQLILTLLEEAAKRKPKGRSLHVYQIGNAIEKYIQDHHSATLEEAAEWALELTGYQLEVSTAITYYYRYRNSKS